MTQDNLSTLIKFANSVVRQAQFIEGDYPFSYGFISKIFDQDTALLARNLKWVFLIDDANIQNVRMRTVLEKFSEAYRQSNNKKFFETTTTDRLREFYV